MLDSTGERERLRWPFVDCDWSGGVFSCNFTPAYSCRPSVGGRDRGVAFSVNIGIRRDQFTRCVSLTFTVTVITS